ncbi:MAG: HAD-IA family hydrolase [Acidimicrobiaceae bacterium]|nr:HAD-IA family hydrolase [Acidimicrobiaceae bacterium]
MISAVLWDFGGVISTSPFDGFAAYERENGLPVGFIRGLNATNPHTNAWAAFERGSVDLDGFASLFEEEARLAGGTVDARVLIEGLRGSVIPEMAEAVRICHRFFKTGLLTNNFRAGDRANDHGGLLDEFDVIVESSLAGCRKPDPRFYLMACEQLDIHPSEAVFLDDLGVNLKPARQLGMTTIKVVDHDQALADLEAVTGLELRSAA